MSRASQFIEFINIQNLGTKKPVYEYYKRKLTDIEITDHIKSVRKKYLKEINKPAYYE
jgi:hypothetical protein